MSDLPRLGEPESATLELKEAVILRRPGGRRKLLREVVGMLNAAGGRILVGARESSSAFAGLDPLAEEDHRHESSFRDALLDAIEPRVPNQECVLRWISVPGGKVLEILVAPRQPRPEPPFCLRQGEDRRYLLRAGDRLRVMSYDELLPRGAGLPGDPRES